MEDLPPYRLCYRCGARLGIPTETEDLGNLYCPHCGASQLSLPEYLRAEELVPVAGAQTTSRTPPPRPRSGDWPIDWRSALLAGAVVAGIAAALTVGGVVSGVLSLLSFLWIVSGGVVALSLYSKQRPTGRMDGRIGARIGLVTGLLVISAVALSLATAGVVARFGLHRMGEFDATLVEFSDTMQTQMAGRLAQDKQPADTAEKVVGMIHSAEVRAGTAIAYLGFLGGLVVVLSAGGGGLAGALRSRRQAR